MSVNVNENKSRNLSNENRFDLVVYFIYLNIDQIKHVEQNREE